MMYRLYDFIKSRHEMTSALKHYSYLMSDGVYVFDDTLTYLKKLGDSPALFLQKKMRKNFLKKMARKILRHTVFVKKINIQENEEKRFLGNILMPVRITGNESDVMVINQDTNQILSIYHSKERYEKCLHSYHFFLPFFSIPKIFGVNENLSFIISELIRFKGKHQWKKADYMNVLDSIYQQYFSYLLYVKNRGDYKTISVQQLYDTNNLAPEFKNIFWEIDPLLRETPFPILKVHGDLWTGNILYGENREVYVIDWEYCHSNLFFYDILSMMWIDYYVENNSFYFDKFINSELDSYFISIFQLFDLSFLQEKRFDYFQIFFLFFVSARNQELDEPYKKSILLTYKKLLKRASHLKQNPLTPNKAKFQKQ